MLIVLDELGANLNSEVGCFPARSLGTPLVPFVLCYVLNAFRIFTSLGPKRYVLISLCYVLAEPNAQSKTDEDPKRSRATLVERNAWSLFLSCL